MSKLDVNKPVQRLYYNNWVDCKVRYSIKYQVCVSYKNKNGHERVNIFDIDSPHIRNKPETYLTNIWVLIRDTSPITLLFESSKDFESQKKLAITNGKYIASSGPHLVETKG